MILGYYEIRVHEQWVYMSNGCARISYTPTEPKSPEVDIFTKGSDGDSCNWFGQRICKHVLGGDMDKLDVSI